MGIKPPSPVCKVYVICHTIFHDRTRHDFALIRPLHAIVAPAFPAVQPLSIFAKLTSVQGEYQLEAELQDFDGEVHWQYKLPKPFAHYEPLHVACITLQNLQIRFPQPGNYELILFANGDEVARDSIHADLPRKPPGQQA